MNYYTGLIFLFVMIPIAIGAVVRHVNSSGSLSRLIDRHEYAIVFLYEAHNRCEFKNESFKRVSEAFEYLSEKGDYCDAGLAFLKGNIKERCIENFAHDYAVSEFPAFLLFKNGRLCGSDQNRAVLYGFPLRAELVSFIKQWLGVEISELVAAEDSRRERDRSYYNNNGLSIYCSVNPGWGWDYYPAYYYWDWPAYRPGFYGGFGYSWSSGGGRRRR